MLHPKIHDRVVYGMDPRKHGFLLRESDIGKVVLSYEAAGVRYLRVAFPDGRELFYAEDEFSVVDAASKEDASRA